VLLLSVWTRQVLERLEALERRSEHPEVVVAGGGYAGIELAATVADRLHGRGRIKVVTADPDILEGAPEGQKEVARDVRRPSPVYLSAFPTVCRQSPVSSVRRCALCFDARVGRLLVLRSRRFGRLRSGTPPEPQLPAARSSSSVR
jgi:hypothetical protein